MGPMRGEFAPELSERRIISNGSRPDFFRGNRGGVLERRGALICYADLSEKSDLDKIGPAIGKESLAKKVSGR